MSATEKRYVCNVYEKAEHWNFEGSTFAVNDEEARKNLKRDYPQKDYRISDIRFDNCYMPNFE